MLEKGNVVFGHWVIDEKIGAGAYGVVYKLKREEFGNTYYSALKVISIPPENVDSSALQSEGMTKEDISTYYADIAKSFMEEIKLLEELKGNSNIVSYEDHIIEQSNDGMSYTIMIRMELLTPFKNIISQRELSQDEICKLGIDICNALELCEMKKIIHRDIKPDNIFLSNTDTYKLGDFGVARTMEKTVSAMSQKGTYTYMAPEVFLGKEYSSNVDLYSLGILLYQLSNKNRTPFLPDASNPILFKDREEARKRRMSGENVPEIEGATKEWNEFIVKACQSDPLKRFQSAVEMRNALNEILKGNEYPKKEKTAKKNGNNGFHTPLKNSAEDIDKTSKKSAAKENVVIHEKHQNENVENTKDKSNRKNKKRDEHSKGKSLQLFKLTDYQKNIVNEQSKLKFTLAYVVFQILANCLGYGIVNNSFNEALFLVGGAGVALIILIVRVANFIMSIFDKAFLPNIWIYYSNILFIFSVIISLNFMRIYSRFGEMIIGLFIILLPVVIFALNKNNNIIVYLVASILSKLGFVIFPIFAQVLGYKIYFETTQISSIILACLLVIVFAVYPIVYNLVETKIKTSKKGE